MSPAIYVAWRTADDVTHEAWRTSADLYADYYTRCEPLRRRRHAEGQGIGNAPITCVFCVVARR